MSEDEVMETLEGEQPPVDVMTCEGAKKEILRLIDERDAIEKQLIERFDKKAFREKKNIDRTIRNLFQDFAVCNIEEEPPQETKDSSEISPTTEPPA